MDVMRADTVDADLDRLLRDRWPGKVRRGGAAELATGRRFSGRPDYPCSGGPNAPADRRRAKKRLGEVEGQKRTHELGTALNRLVRAKEGSNA